MLGRKLFLMKGEKNRRNSPLPFKYFIFPFSFSSIYMGKLIFCIDIHSRGGRGLRLGAEKKGPPGPGGGMRDNEEGGFFCISFHLCFEIHSFLNSFFWMGLLILLL